MAFCGHVSWGIHYDHQCLLVSVSTEISVLYIIRYNFQIVVSAIIQIARRVIKTRKTRSEGYSANPCPFRTVRFCRGWNGDIDLF